MDACLVTPTTATTMAEDTSPVALLRLMTWLSPAFPVGAFAYSHGIERAIHDGLVRDRATLVDWLGDILTLGSGWNDAVIAAEAWRKASAGEDCRDVAELAEAMAGSRERHMETTLQGGAFREAVSAWPGDREIPQERRASGGPEAGGTKRPIAGDAPARPVPYPIAVGAAAALHAIPLEATLTAYCHAFSSNLIQAAVRLIPLGQRDGVAALASLEPILLDTAQRALRSSLDDLGSCTMMSDIMSMQHEVQYSRVFRS